VNLAGLELRATAITNHSCKPAARRRHFFSVTGRQGPERSAQLSLASIWVIHDQLVRSPVGGPRRPGEVGPPCLRMAGRSSDPERQAICCRSLGWLDPTPAVRAAGQLAVPRKLPLGAHALVLGRRAVRAARQFAEQLPHGARGDACARPGAAGQCPPRADRGGHAGGGRARLRARPQDLLRGIGSETRPPSVRCHSPRSRPRRSYRLAVPRYGNPEGARALGRGCDRRQD
jgi:hypothetical protein